MGDRLEGKVALITGAGMGMGREACEVFAREGARIVALDVDEAAVADTAMAVQAGGGDILTCAGSSMTFGDGVPALKWTDENGDWIANDCTFTPVQGGMWSGQIPEDGYLEEVL